MGRWTPLVLMAGGLAILLGTLLGISFPMGGQNTAQAPNGGKTSRVLPANINVNSTAAGNAPANNNRSVVQNNNTVDDTATETTTAQNTSQTTAQNTTTEPSSTIDDTQSTTETTQNNAPIPALW